MDALGTVAALWRYPVKSLRGEQLARASVAVSGFEGDRGLAIADARTGEILSAKRVAALLEGRARGDDGAVEIMLPDRTPIRVVPGEATADAEAALGSWLGREVALMRPPSDRPVIAGEDGESFRGMAGTFFDSSPVHLVTTATLRHLHGLFPDGAFDPRRFRPNLVLEAAGDEPVEQTWVGATVEVGSVRLLIRKPCRRCVITTLAQDELPRDRGILRTVARDTDNAVGVYAVVERPGEITVGDVLRPV